MNLLLWAGLSLSSPALAANPRVEELDLWPASPAELGVDEPYYLRLTYEFNRPVRLHAHPWRADAPLTTYTAGATPRFVGQGTALLWFSLPEAGEVDAISVLATPAGGGPAEVVMVVPVALTFREEASPAREAPIWLAPMQAQQVALLQAQAAERADQPDWILRGLVATGAAVALGGVVWPLVLVRRYRGWWRASAAVPLVLLTVVAGRIIVDLRTDPDSHPLWPFLILQTALGSLLYSALLALTHRSFSPSPPTSL